MTSNIHIKGFLAAAIMAAPVLLAHPAAAALKVGDKAPDFSLPAATNGHVKTFSLKAALRHGPVVVYFYPKAFTSGCSLEAHEFSEAMPQFKARHASVIGVSGDDVDTLKKFSKETCAGKFPVAADPDMVASIQYDAKIPFRPMATRVSYVIDRKGIITFVHEDADASTHVKSLLEAVKTSR
ncbi:MAG: peroxiredoxin [Asticcacaulis sp.]